MPGDLNEGTPRNVQWMVVDERHGEDEGWKRAVSGCQTKAVKDIRSIRKLPIGRLTEAPWLLRLSTGHTACGHKYDTTKYFLNIFRKI
jgi:hypothetical protein